MCGIFGIFGLNNSEHEILRCLHLMDHRGPDDFGIYKVVNKHLRGWLGQTRLSIQDTSAAGHQPMRLGEKYSIVFNGEVYNFKELADELEELGSQFHSKTDTEVILHAYKQWGISCLEKFNGMFAIAIVDHEKEEVFLARDRIGIKPLYYWHDGDVFGFSSELKSLTALKDFDRTICNEAFMQYLQWQYVPAPLSIYENTFKLPQGSYAIYKKGQIQVKEWWNPADFFNKPKFELSNEELIAQAEKLLQSSVRYRMISDVPVGCFLSGGIDSSLVAATMASLSKNKIKTFSIGVNHQELNEAQYAKEIAKYLGTEHYEQYISESDLTSLIPQLSYYWDEPFSDSSALPTMLVSKLARQHVTVSLSGDGGDELFCGYYRYGWMEQLNRIGKIPIARGLASSLLKSNIFDFLGIGSARRLKKAGATLSWKNVEDQYRCLSNIWYQGHLEKLLSKPVSTNNPTKKVFALEGSLVEKLMLADIQNYMVEDILVKVDRASMSTSLEARVPLLDHRLVEFALQVPMRHKRSDGVTKVLLRNLLEKHVPRSLWERPKAGFEIPIKSWLMKDLYDWMMDLFSKQSCDHHGLFNQEELHHLIKQHQSGKYDYAYQLWTLAMFQDWYNRHIS